MLERNENIRAVVQNFGSSGEGVCILGGFPVFVPGALPGEEISATVTLAKKNFAQARLGQIHRPSPRRTLPPCPYYERCGGCSMMHMDYGYSTAAKVDMIKSALWHVGRIAPDSYEMEQMMPSPQRLAYRNKAMYRVNPATKRLGFFEAKSRGVVDIGDCLLQTPLSNAAKEEVEGWLGRYPSEITSVMIRVTQENALMCALMSSESRIRNVDKLIESLAKIDGGELKSLVHCAPQNQDYPGRLVDVLYGKSTVTDRLCRLNFTLSPQSFFQVNHGQTENLYMKAMEYLEPSGKNVVDAYCGAGTLSLLAAKLGAAFVCGVEDVAPAVENAMLNAGSNGLANCAFVCAKVEDALPELFERQKFDGIILDPPRKGCDGRAISAVIASGVERVVYVSCNPATLARDLRLLYEGGYLLRKLAPVDMFPQTPHVECVVLISRVD